MEFVRNNILDVLQIDVKKRSRKREVAASRFIFFGILKHYYPNLAETVNRNGGHSRMPLSSTDVMEFLELTNHSSVLYYKKAFKNNMHYADFKQDYYRVLNVCEPNTKYGIETKQQLIKDLQQAIIDEKNELNRLVKDYYKYEVMGKKKILQFGDKKIYIIKEFEDYYIVSNTKDKLKKYKLDKDEISSK
jgi:hypothetical protein